MPVLCFGYSSAFVSTMLRLSIFLAVPEQWAMQQLIRAWKNWLLSTVVLFSPTSKSQVVSKILSVSNLHQLWKVNLSMPRLPELSNWPLWKVTWLFAETRIELWNWNQSVDGEVLWLVLLHFIAFLLVVAKINGTFIKLDRNEKGSTLNYPSLLHTNYCVRSH